MQRAIYTTLFIVGSPLVVLAQTLEEVTVTSQKRAADLQDTPIAVSVLDSNTLESMGLQTLGDLMMGAVPSIRVSPNGGPPTTVTAAIRGRSPVDVAPVTRDGTVDFYVDNVPRFMPQGLGGLGFDLADAQRVEILRGPQGTLFGKNSTGGVVHIVSKAPSGELGFYQEILAGTADEFRSVTRINLPENRQLRSKIAYVESQRDGLVENRGGVDYNAFERSGYRIAVDWGGSETVLVSYVHDSGDLETTQNYPQLFENITFDILPEERTRQTKTRFAFPIPLEPTTTETSGHSVTANLAVTEDTTLQSITAYRQLEESVRSNYGGALYNNGLLIFGEIEHEQLTQEIQLVGTYDRLDWVSGIFYSDQSVREDSGAGVSIDLFSDPIALLDPPTIFPTTRIVQDSRSIGIYGQLTWTPVEPLHLTVGLRQSYDDKDGYREVGVVDRYNIDDENLDYTVSVQYNLAKNMQTYLKNATAYSAQGVQPRSRDFVPFGVEEVDSWEAGLKSEFWDQRIRLNVAGFYTETDGLVIDAIDPDDILNNVAFNAQNTVYISGVEIDVTALVGSDLRLGLSYGYLDGSIPDQPDPFNAIVANLTLPQAPRHSSSISADYEVGRVANLGMLVAHLDVAHSDDFAHISSDVPRGERVIANARITLAGVKLKSSELSLSAWVRNLTDEEYPVLAFPTAASVVYAFGDRRTAGVRASIKF